MYLCINKNIIKNFLASLGMILFLGLGLSPRNVFAATIALVQPEKPVVVGQDLSLVVNLTPDGASVNAFSAKIAYPKDLFQFTNSIDTDTVVTSWIKHPKDDHGEISFEGVLVGGFDGIIDPFSPKVPLVGKITTLHFKALKSGNGSITLDDGHTFTNDGKGTDRATGIISVPVTVIKGLAIASLVDEPSASNVPIISIGLILAGCILVIVRIIFKPRT
jgi:hypothetical protein